MELPIACINRQVIRFSRLQNDLVECWNKCLKKDPLVHLQMKIALISIVCLMNYVIKHVFSTKRIQIPMTKFLHFISVEVING